PATAGRAARAASAARHRAHAACDDAEGASGTPATRYRRLTPAGSTKATWNFSSHASARTTGNAPNYTSPMQTSSRRRTAATLLRLALAALLLCNLAAYGNKGPLVVAKRTSH